MTFKAHELEFLLEAKQIETKIERGEMGTITHEELKRLMLAKQAENRETTFALPSMDVTAAEAAVERLTTLFADMPLDDFEMYLNDSSLALANIDSARL